MDFLKSAAAAYQQHANKDDEDKPTTTQQTTQQSAPQSSAAPSSDPDLTDANDAHDKVYQQGKTQEASEEELGKAAGVQAFKEYEKYEKDEQSERSEEGGGQGKLVQMVMAEVQKLMSGGGGKDNSEVLKNAIAMATKLFMSKSGGGEGSGGGGLGSLMSNPKVAEALQNPQIQGMLKKFM
ncbi:hypothetical protein BGZ75_009347 [Mortierella antarctica]|nr:hypothetical protein BGZ67_001445 [Mortierella alpina]KAF9979673.1 hypothetical protein BGZ75_009347 [Mortierella antarctica]